MILYLDTSALVKLYVEEVGTATVEQAVEETEFVATSIVTYAEARSALARKRRDGALSEEGYREAVASLEEEWSAYQVIHVTKDAVRLAGDLTERHALRGFDAIHLASALLLEEDAGHEMRFLAFDDRLTEAAQRALRMNRRSRMDEPGA